MLRLVNKSARSQMLPKSVDKYRACWVRYILIATAFIQGKIPIVVEAHSADIIATLIVLKAEVEAKMGSKIKMTISGATEAHLLAKEIGEASVGVVFVNSRPYPAVWEQQRL